MVNVSADSSPTTEVSLAVAANTPEQISWRRGVAYGFVAFFVARLCVIAGAGVQATQQVVDSNKAGEPRPDNAVGLITDVLMSWDGRWYMEVARSGYPRFIPPNITYEQVEASGAFFPVFPMLVRTVNFVLPGGDTFAALLTNLVLSLIAIVLVGKLALRLSDMDTAVRAMILFAVFPGSYVLSFAYSEATLIVAAAACLLLLHDERWLLAGIAAAIGTATRPNGVALIAACAVAAAIAIIDRRDWKALIAPALSPIGFIGFQYWLGRRTGEQGVWFRIQSEAWSEGTSFGGTAVRTTLSFLSEPLTSPTDALTVVSLLAMFGGLWCAWKRPLPLPILAYVLVVIVLMLLPATVTARPRFLFTAFPLFIPVAAWWPRRDRFGWDMYLVTCGAGLAVLTGLYGVFGAIP